MATATGGDAWAARSSSSPTPGNGPQHRGHPPDRDDAASAAAASGSDGRHRSNGGSGSDSGSGSGLQSVERAIAVMELLGHGDSTVSELANQLDVHKSTVSRLLSTLQNHGLVEVADTRGRYRLGYGLVRLAGMIGGQLDITTQGNEICSTLARDVGETVTLSVLQENLAVTIYQVNGGSTVTLENWLGRATAPHATSSGKVLLAFLPTDELDDLLDAGLQSYTEQTVTEESVLRDQLGQIAERGFTIAVEEYETGLNAIAAPIRIHDGTAPYALSMSGPAFRLGLQDLQRLTDPLMIAADELSRRMGHSGF